jgi:hypothetical protein
VKRLGLRRSLHPLHPCIAIQLQLVVADRQLSQKHCFKTLAYPRFRLESLPNWRAAPFGSSLFVPNVHQAYEQAFLQKKLYRTQLLQFTNNG